MIINGINYRPQDWPIGADLGESYYQPGGWKHPCLAIVPDLFDGTQVTTWDIVPLTAGAPE